MKTVSLKQMRAFLEEEYAKSQTDKGYFKNFLFVGGEGYGRSSVIRDWLGSHPEMNPFYDLYAMPLFVEKDGEYVKELVNGQEQYVLGDNQLKTLAEPNRVVVSWRLNWGRDFRGNIPLLSILKDRTYLNGFGKEYDLHSIKFFIGTVFPSDEAAGIENLTPEMEEQFEIIRVVPHLNEVVAYEIGKWTARIEHQNKRSAENPDENYGDPEEYKKILSMLERMKGLDAEFTPSLPPAIFSRAIHYDEYNTYLEFVDQLEKDVKEWNTFIDKETELLIDTLKKA